jgi:hypothetical protein
VQLKALTSKNFWQRLIAGSIVCAAFAIMLPDFGGYLLGLSRVAVFVVAIFLGAGILGYVSRRDRTTTGGLHPPLSDQTMMRRAQTKSTLEASESNQE